MEELSSTDSNHKGTDTDGADVANVADIANDADDSDSILQRESELAKETIQNCTDATVAENHAEDETMEPITKTAKDTKLSADEANMVNENARENDTDEDKIMSKICDDDNIDQQEPDDTDGNDEVALDDFEQISEGRCEDMEDNLHTIAANKTPTDSDTNHDLTHSIDKLDDVNNVFDNKAENEIPQINDDNHSQVTTDESITNLENTEITEDEAVSNDSPSNELNEILVRNETDRESRSFEEIDASSLSANNHSANEEESDMLGEADNTLPQSSAINESTDVAMNDTEDDSGPMDVETDSAMDETMNSNKEDELKTSDMGISDIHMDEEINERIDEDENENEIENEQIVNKEVPDAVKEADSNNSLQFSTNYLESKTIQNSCKIPTMEVDQQEEEPVENVQEPEDSDVCLIPDDTEKEVTEAEKEQAILAKENAEREDEVQQQANTTESVTSKDKKDQQAKNANTNAEAAESVTAPTEILKDENQDQKSETKPDKTLLEQMHSTTTAATAATATTAVTATTTAATIESNSTLTTKVSIGWIVNVRKICKQCNKEKNCGFRIKNCSDTTDVVEYLCQQKCCDALMSAYPGKYVIRRKKFLLDDLTAAGDSLHTPDSLYRCLQCQQEKSCKYFFKQDDDIFYVCNDDCFNLLSADEPEKFKLKRHSIRVRNIGATTNLPSETNRKSGGGGQHSRTILGRNAEEAETARLERASSFQRRCTECYGKISLGDKLLVWEIMDFCNEICLGKHQRAIGSKCQTCQGSVPHTALGKYCVRFGFAVRQFCCAACLNEFKKGLKTCSCCQKDISGTNEGFLAPVGDKEQFKDFCSQTCMRRYDRMANPKRKLRNDVCEVCNNDKPVRVEILLDDKEHTFCSNPCFSAFKFVSNIVADQCGMCNKYFERKSSENFTIYTEKRPKVFCSRICLNIFIALNRHIVACQWCKVKKYNFDMISTRIENEDVLMCSLNCLTLYGVSLKAFSRTTAVCDNCSTTAPPQYHLTMSDASMRNFCTYQCVMQFQQQFRRIPLTLEMDNQTTSVVTAAASSQIHKLGSKNANSTTPFPTGLPKRVKLEINQQTEKVTPMKLSSKAIASSKKGPTTQTPTAMPMPIISTVSSLASGETETMIGNVTVRRNRGIRTRKIDSSPPPPPPLPPPLPLSLPPPASAPTLAPAASPTSAPSASALPALTNIGNSNSTTVVSQPRGRPRKNAISDRTLSPSPPNGSKRANSLGEKFNEKLPNSRQGETKIITVPPYPPTVRNVQTNCKPQTVECGMQTSPQLSTQSIQTEKDYSNKILIPVPIPLYVPVPMRMYSLPFPVPVPIPLPIPVPIFIPTTRNSAKGIMKEIKKIQDKMPADPFEAELLMMAEMVAEEKDESNSDSEDEDEIKADPSNDVIHYNNNTATIQTLDDVTDNQHGYGEDVLQMAIKMATDEYDQQPTHNTVDLENAMTTNTISNPSELLHDDNKNITHLNEHSLQQQTHLLDQRNDNYSRKRTSPLTQNNNRQTSVKRQRFDTMERDTQAIQPPMEVNEKPDAHMCLKFTFGVNAWKQWVIMKNTEIDKSSIRRRPFKTELLQMTADELNYSLCLFVKEVRKPNGTEYAPDTIYYLVLGIQQYLYENGRIDNIFTDPYYENFTDCLDEIARKFSILYNDSHYIVTRVEEEHLWECKQLGAHSPHVLLCTLMFFNTKHFNLTTVDEHMQLSFSHIMKHWKRNPQNCKTPGTRNVLLRFYPPQSGIDSNPRKKKVYEQQENEENPLRCPVRLYEFYLSKCPESVKTRNDVFYLQPERSCVPDSPVWYSTQPLSRESLQKMLHRVKMVKEINIALLTS